MINSLSAKLNSLDDKDTKEFLLTLTTIEEVRLLLPERQILTLLSMPRNSEALYLSRVSSLLSSRNMLHVSVICAVCYKYTCGIDARLDIKQHMTRSSLNSARIHHLLWDGARIRSTNSLLSVTLVLHCLILPCSDHVIVLLKLQKGETIKNDAKRMQDKFTGLTDTFTAFVDKFKTWAAHGEKIKKLSKEIEEIDKKIHDIDIAMTVIGAGLAVTLPATCALALYFPLVSPWVIVRPTECPRLLCCQPVI